MKKNNLDYCLLYAHIIWEVILIPYYQVEAIYIRARNRQSTRY
jgi:NADH:ubiquinone oxidoreductase subunit 4 (subunit M)